MKYMKRALILAAKGRGKVSPNPMVGAVIVYNSRIIGEGFHKNIGGKHAEVEALDSVEPDNQELLKHSTLYCTLEPCSQRYPGKKQPPCCDGIIKAGIKKVTISHLDPNPMVSGSGVSRLKEAGIEVEVGLLEAEAKELNRGFLTHITKKRPYIHLKWAQSLDGKVATGAGISKWITNENCRKETHFHRSMCDGIIVGTKTLLEDDPTLDARYGFNPSPRPIVIDRELNLDRSLKVFNRDPIIVTRSEKADSNCIVYRDSRIPLNELLEELPSRGINSLFVEGGSNLLTQFIKDGLWDRITIYISPKLLGEGLSPLGDIGVNHPKESPIFSRTELTNIDDHFVFNGWT